MLWLTSNPHFNVPHFGRKAVSHAQIHENRHFVVTTGREPAYEFTPFKLQDTLKYPNSIFPQVSAIKKCFFVKFVQAPGSQNQQNQEYRSSLCILSTPLYVF